MSDLVWVLVILLSADPDVDSYRVVGPFDSLDECAVAAAEAREQEGLEYVSMTCEGWPDGTELDEAVEARRRTE